MTIQRFETRLLDELEPTFDAMANAGMQAVTLNPEGLAFQGRVIIPKLALARRLALCAYSRETFETGALMSYGTDQRAKHYLSCCRDQGARPFKPTTGSDVPQALLARADEVIE